VTRAGNLPTAAFNVSTQAAAFGFALERSTELRSWTTIAQRAAGAASFQTSIPGVTIQETPQAQMIAVRVNDTVAPAGLARYYRVTITR
jgi:hypothetical protein